MLLIKLSNALQCVRASHWDQNLDTVSEETKHISNLTFYGNQVPIRQQHW